MNIMNNWHLDWPILSTFHIEWINALLSKSVNGKKNTQDEILTNEITYGTEVICRKFVVEY